eukprot:18988-Heterococcus_DN1.PRE.2
MSATYSSAAAEQMVLVDPTTTQCAVQITKVLVSMHRATSSTFLLGVAHRVLLRHCQLCADNVYCAN